MIEQLDPYNHFAGIAVAHTCRGEIKNLCHGQHPATSEKLNSTLLKVTLIIVKQPDFDSLHYLHGGKLIN
jgi:hypothetical protein